MIIKYSCILFLLLISLQLKNIGSAELEDYIDMDYYDEATQEVQYVKKVPVWIPGSGILIRPTMPTAKNGEHYKVYVEMCFTYECYQQNVKLITSVSF